MDNEMREQIERIIDRMATISTWTNEKLKRRMYELDPALKSQAFIYYRNKPDWILAILRREFLGE